MHLTFETAIETASPTQPQGDVLFVGGAEEKTVKPVGSVRDDDVQRLLRQFCRYQKPPLQSHFEAQVDILMALARAADRELFVANNASANREAFCRLFLASHLPPHFRVTSGEVIDFWHNTTGQLDVVIVNELAPMMAID
jgi:hypothetical protein